MTNILKDYKIVHRTLVTAEMHGKLHDTELGEHILNDWASPFECFDEVYRVLVDAAPENVIVVDKYGDVEAIKSLFKKIDIHLLNMEVSAWSEDKKQISENAARSLLIREELNTATIILDKLILLLSKVDH